MGGIGFVWRIEAVSNKLMVKTKEKTSQTVVPSRHLTPLHFFEPPQHVKKATISGDRSPDNMVTGPGPGHDFGQIQVHYGKKTESCPLSTSPTFCPFGGACHSCPPRVQAKLTIGQQNDQYEREADKIADQVMHIPRPHPVHRACPTCDEEEPLRTKPSTSSLIQRQVEAEEEEKEDEEDEKLLQAKPLASQITPLIKRQDEPKEDDGKLIQAKQAPGQSPRVDPKLTPYIQSLRGRGQPLSESTRAFFEPRFGYNFSRVRVHADTRATELAHAVNARACTIGSDVAFGSGQYQPETTEGKQLLAHELTHVMQQRTGYFRLQRKEEKLPCTVHAYDASDPEDTAVIPKDGSGIGVTSVADMVSKVNVYVDEPKNACSCVSRLEINGHGSDGNQSVGDGIGVEEDKRLDADSTNEHLNQLARIKFCPFGLFMMLGCHVGRSRGKKLMGRLARILPGKLIGGAQHFTAGVGFGKKRVTGAGDVPGTPYTEKDPFLTSKFVRWYIVIDGKEYIINGDETTSTEGKAKLKVAEKIKVKTPSGVVRIK